MSLPRGGLFRFFRNSTRTFFFFWLMPRFYQTCPAVRSAQSATPPTTPATAMTRLALALAACLLALPALTPQEKREIAPPPRPKGPPGTRVEVPHRVVRVSPP